MIPFYDSMTDTYHSIVVLSGQGQAVSCVHGLWFFVHSRNIQGGTDPFYKAR